MKRYGLSEKDYHLLVKLCDWEPDTQLALEENEKLPEWHEKNLVNLFLDEGSNVEFVSVPAWVRDAIGRKEKEV